MNETSRIAFRQVKTTVAEHFGALIANGPGSLPDEAAERARECLLDTLGCMVLGIAQPEARQAIAAMQGLGAGDSVVVGHDQTLAPLGAALVNGTSAHALDLDDWDEPSTGHTSAVLVPALLAGAPSTMTMDQFWQAMVIGIEVAMRIGASVNLVHYEKGWHATNTILPIAAAAAVAFAKGLDRTEAANALSMATSMAAGYNIQFGSSAKPLHAGLAAKSGILAAALAASGSTAAREAIESPFGFAGLLCDATPEDFASALWPFDGPWGIVEPGLHKKIYPSCGGTHLIIEAAEEIHAAHGLSPDEIEDIEIVTSQLILDILPYRAPNSVPEALFSLPWCAACGLVLGKVGTEAFAQEMLQRCDLLALSHRARVSVHPRHGNDVFNADHPDILRVTTTGGKVLEHAVAYPKGSPQRPASRRELVDKFRMCCRSRMPGPHVERLVSFVETAGHDQSIADLLDLLRCDSNDENASRTT